MDAVNGDIVNKYKIHIIGGPGSGKTYLSDVIAKNFNIDRYDLDDIFWDNAVDAYGIKADEKKRDKDLLKILAGDSWVIEGVYYGWLYRSFQKADIIFVLKTNVFLRDWRIIKRFLMRKTGRQYAGKKETLGQLVNLIKWNHSYDANQLKEAEKMIKVFNYKTVEIKNNNLDVVGFLGRLKAST